MFGKPPSMLRPSRSDETGPATAHLKIRRRQAGLPQSLTSQYSTKSDLGSYQFIMLPSTANGGTAASSAGVRCARARARCQRPKPCRPQRRCQDCRRSRQGSRGRAALDGFYVVRTSLAACAPASCCTCSPATSNGTCAESALPSCSTRTTRPAPKPRTPPSSLRQSPRLRPVARPPASARRTARRCMPLAMNRRVIRHRGGQASCTMMSAMACPTLSAASSMSRSPR